MLTGTFAAASLVLTLFWILTFVPATRRVMARAVLAPYRLSLRRARWILALSATTAFVTSVIVAPTKPDESLSEPLTSAKTAVVAATQIKGAVLIAGGCTNEQVPVLDSAELYNPAIGVFSATGSMTSPRTDFAAVLLGNGKVLVTGGVATSPATGTPLDTAEIYDPQTGTFGRTGNMSHGRTGHTATLLSDGRVLIAGGSDGHVTQSSAELYDPVSGAFASTGSMNLARAWPTATLLRDGTVLVAGRVLGLEDSAEPAEVYDPHSGNFTATDDMITQCTVGSAILLPDGQVLLAGNDTRWTPEPAVEVPCAEVYDPQSRTFNRMANPQSVCGSFAAANLKDAGVLLAGGSDDCVFSHVGGLSAELYLPSSRSFRHVGKMNVARYDLDLTPLGDGRVLVTGGLTGAGPMLGPGAPITDTAEIYDPETGRFTLTGKMITARSGHAALLLQTPTSSRQP